MTIAVWFGRKALVWRHSEWGSMDLVIAVADPRVEDVRGLLEAHLAFCREVTPPGHVHAFEVEDFSDPAVILVGARRDGMLVGVGALKRLDGQHAASATT